MQIIEKSIKDIHPYENNPRINDDAVDAVAASIKEFGFIDELQAGMYKGEKITQAERHAKKTVK